MQERFENMEAESGLMMVLIEYNNNNLYSPFVRAALPRPG